MPSPAPAKPDTTDMHAIHRAFLRNLGDAPCLIESVDGEARAALIQNFFDNILGLLHVHHAAEDELMYPVLDERCGTDADTVRRIGGQHRDVDNAIQDAQQCLQSWTFSDATSGDRLAQALLALRDQLDTHLGDEERLILPLAADHMSPEEWEAMPGHAMRSYPGDKLWLALGLVRENMTQEQRDLMLAAMPPPLVAMWTTEGLSSFTKLVAQVREPQAARN